MNTNDNIIIFATSHGTMSIYKDNIYLFSKSKFTKIIKLMKQDWLVWEYNRLELKQYLETKLRYFNDLNKNGCNEYCNISIKSLIARFEYYLFFLEV